MSTLTNNPPSHQPQTYEVKGMHCGSCVGKVKAALMPLGENVEVTLTPPRAIINSAASLATLNETLAAIGNYTLHALSSDIVANKPISLILNRPVKPAETLEQKSSWFKTYQPLLLVIGFILIAGMALLMLF